MKKPTQQWAGVTQTTTMSLVRAAGYLVLISGVMIMYGVVMRYIFHKGVAATFEVPRLIVMAFIGLSLAYVESKDKHIRVDLIAQALPLTVQKIIRLFSHLLTTIFLMVLLWATVIKTADDWVVRTDISRVPFAPFTIVLCIGFLAFILQITVSAGRDLGIYSKPKAEAAHQPASRKHLFE